MRARANARLEGNGWAGRMAALGFLALIILAWWGLARVYPPYILPAPGTVWIRGVAMVKSGELLRHFLITGGESLGGFAAGALIALPLGYVMARLPWLERALAPYLVASQAVPIVALAPLIIIWFGFGLTSKVLIAALVAFFPVLINVVVGLRNTPPRMYELMRVLGADRWQVFAKLEVPGALPVLLGGFRVGLALSVIGAVVGEFASSDRGLGYLVNLSAGMLDTTLLFVALISLAMLGTIFHLLLVLAERILASWARQGSEEVR